MTCLTFDDVSGLVVAGADGGLTWLVDRGRRFKAGSPAGTSLSDEGYQIVGLRGKNYKAHRVIWLLTYGEWPTQEIDHIDGDRLNNRVGNLRDVPKTVNQQNQRKPGAKNTSGFLGVRFFARSGRWQSSIRVEGRNLHLGYFDSPELAHSAYVAAKRVHHDGCTI